MIRHSLRALALAFTAIVVAIAAPAAFAQVAGEGPVIVTQGEASVRQAPDIAWVQIAVEARGAKPADARERAAEAMTAVLATLKQSLPADALKTSGFSIQPEMDYSGGTSKLKDYVARNTIEARVDNLEKLAPVMDAAVGSGATSVGGIRFDVKARGQLERDALKLAVQDGLERAQAIAAGANRSAGPIVRIQEQRMSSGPIMQTLNMNRGVAGGIAMTQTPIMPGEIEVRASVTVTVSLK